MISSACKQANHRQDLAQFVKVAQSSLAGNELLSGCPASANLPADQHEQQSSSQADKLTIRYQQFQPASIQSTELHHQLDPKNMVSSAECSSSGSS